MVELDRGRIEEKASAAPISKFTWVVVFLATFACGALMLDATDPNRGRESPEAEELHRLLAQLPGSGLVWDRQKQRLEWARPMEEMAK